ncbi:hypothetical protein [Candidatus Magnetomonas plexicatena]|uniref:hypothetical protein n=1 Tax=Candidatus Magnetomonas plexicatena TaxID=2552947 RepID=UPI0011003B07|nr:hypothetical protein E2O03_003595 [Nitrospirales bacterium LBB_01]
MKVADMTVDQLESLIERVVGRLLDPDYGLEMKDEFVNKVLSSMNDKEGYTSLEEVKREYASEIIEGDLDCIGSPSPAIISIS